MKKFCLFALCFVWCWGASGALALTDADYRALMKKAAFAEADEKLNEAWAAAKKAMPPAEFKELQKEQKEWISKGRDAEAKELIEAGLPETQAYANVTNDRALGITVRADKSFLMQHADGPQGYYVMKEQDGMNGEMRVRWHGAEKSELRVDIEAALVLSPENVRTGAMSGSGVLEDGAVTVCDEEDPDAAMTVMFKGDKAEVTTTEAFKTGDYCGMGVELDGTYVRQKVKK